MLQLGWFLLVVATVMGALETMESLGSRSLTLMVCLLVSGATLTIAGAIARLQAPVGAGDAGGGASPATAAPHGQSDPAGSWDPAAGRRQ